MCLCPSPLRWRPRSSSRPRWSSVSHPLRRHDPTPWARSKRNPGRSRGSRSSRPYKPSLFEFRTEARGWLARRSAAGLGFSGRHRSERRRSDQPSTSKSWCVLTWTMVVIGSPPSTMVVVLVIVFDPWSLEAWTLWVSLYDVDELKVSLLSISVVVHSYELTPM